MIVVDANVTVYFYVGSPRTSEVQQLLKVDDHWVVPQFWHYEFRNAMLQYVRYQNMDLGSAMSTIRQAERRFQKRVVNASASEVMALANSSRCSSYDCEYVALAQKEGMKLVTYDKQVLREFPDIALRPLEYIELLNNEKNA